VFFQSLGEFRRAGGFTGTLQARQQHHHRRLGVEIETDARFAHEFGEFIAHHANERLTGGERADDFLTQGANANAIQKIFDDRQRNVGFQQGHPHFAQRGVDIFFGQSGFAPQAFDDAVKPFA
jgi:hypothetical protein